MIVLFGGVAGSIEYSDQFIRFRNQRLQVGRSDQFSFNQKAVSSVSSTTIPNLAINSTVDRARHVAR
jgi:hypothetical protein